MWFKFHVFQPAFFSLSLHHSSLAHQIFFPDQNYDDQVIDPYSSLRSYFSTFSLSCSFLSFSSLSLSLCPASSNRSLPQLLSRGRRGKGFTQEVLEGSFLQRVREPLSSSSSNLRSLLSSHQVIYR